MNDDITKLRNENIPAFHRSLKEGMYSSREIGRELFRSALNWINGLEKVASDAITRAENAEAEVERAEAKAHEFESEAIHNDEIMQSLAAEVAALRVRIAELEAADQWRPVSEPPPRDGDYLVFRRPDLKYQSNARPDAVMMVAWFKAGRTRHTGELCEWFNNPIILPITHWRPLPEPPHTGETK